MRHLHHNMIKRRRYTMFEELVLLSIICLVSCDSSCYWSRKCPYHLFSSKTSYETIRGDLRDQPSTNCNVISIWTIHRHGNRNPGSGVTADIKALQEKILEELSSAPQQTICSQDLEDLLNWRWNSTLEEAASELTGTGYEELFDIGKRIAHRYMDPILKSSDGVYLRSTDSQRTIASALAFAHGLTAGIMDTNFTVRVDQPREADDIIRPYENCKIYQEQVKTDQRLADELAAYDSSAEFLAVRDRVQAKLNIPYILSPEDVYTLYELCRFERSWSIRLRSPWCSFFTDQDLVVLEYRDDVRHYYRNGYGSLVNVKLGALPLKDLYERFENATRDNGNILVSYFTHNAMMEMIFCALGLYKDTEPLRGSLRNANRLWRSSEIGSFATNIIAVLHRCAESGEEAHRIQFFINEKPTDVCPQEGCTWQQFRDKFRNFSEADLDFCDSDELEPVVEVPSSGFKTFRHRLVIHLLTFVPMSIYFGK